jgi:RNA polymerase nonessential primary-like sigma factor
MVEAIVSEGVGAEAGADSLSAYLREVGRTRVPTRTQEKALLERMGRGDKSARNELITANLKIVVSVCRDYRDRGLPLGDLIAEGNLGLIRAAQSFEIGHGRFAPFAEWWIHRCIRRALEEQARFRSAPAGPRPGPEPKRAKDGSAAPREPGALPRIDARGNR